MLIPYRGVWPTCHESVFVADGAKIVGDVTIGEGSSVWFNTVVRGDVNWIRIGRRTNIQDNSTLHVLREKFPLTIGDEVSIAHGVNLHGCVIEDLVLVGIGAIVLDGAVVGRGSVIGAGAVVAPGTVVPPNSLVLGVPGKVVKDLGEVSEANNRRYADNYATYVSHYREGGEVGWSGPRRSS